MIGYTKKLFFHFYLYTFTSLFFLYFFHITITHVKSCGQAMSLGDKYQNFQVYY